MAEEVEATPCEPIGNFPQAYTHVGLISAALSLQERALGNFPQAYSHVGLIGAALAIEARRRTADWPALPREEVLA